MALFDELRRGARKVPWGAFAHVVAENLHARTESASQVLDQLKEWGAHLTANAVLKWSVTAAQALPCGSPDVSSGRPRACGSFAVGHCDVCGRPCCLAHARVDYQGDMICEVCIGLSKKRQRAEGTPWQASAPGAEPPRAKKSKSKKPRDEKAEAEAEAREDALRVLRLSDDATWEQIGKRYKKMVFRYNADRPQTVEERDRNTEKLKRINVAFETLRKIYEKAA